MSEMVDKLKAILESEEGKKATEEYFGRLARADKRQRKRVKRLNKLVQTLTNESLHNLVVRYCKWEEKIQDRLYYRGIDGSSTLMGVVFDFFQEYGTELEIEDMFQTARYQFRNYEMSLYEGQGCFFKIEYIQKTRLI